VEAAPSPLHRRRACGFPGSAPPLEKAALISRMVKSLGSIGYIRTQLLRGLHQALCDFAFDIRQADVETSWDGVCPFAAKPKRTIGFSESGSPILF
jgi:hypothetical protein